MTDPTGPDDASEPRSGTALDMPTEPGPSPRSHLTAAEAVAGTCPYLTSTGGSWRAASPSRDHRCGALDPPAPQPTDKQRKHCLSADHVECPTFRAARAARTTTLAGGSNPALVDAADRRRRPLARTAPILLERPRLLDQAVRLQLDRAPGQLALIGLMVLAFAVVALTRLSSGSGADASPSAEPSSAAVIGSPSPRPIPSPIATPDSSASPSVAASGAFRTTYKVKKGDTLLAIAKRFGTTSAKIKILNGLKSSTLKVGQVLKIP
jgi:LysM repeat protein